MPQTQLTASNIQWKNLNIGVADRAMTVPLLQAFGVQNGIGQLICNGTKQMNGARLAIAGIFENPRPANLPGGPAPLAIGDTIDWVIQDGNFVVNAVLNAGAAAGLPGVAPVPAPPVGGIAQQIANPEVSTKALLSIGFQEVARWQIQGNELEFVDINGNGWRSWSPALYAHCEGNSVRYIGHTTRELCARIDDYRRGLGKATNARVHNNTRDVLQNEGTVTILAFCPDHRIEWGGFPIDLPAALEGVLINHFQPDWNV
jgi:hypothetical protein